MCRHLAYLGPPVTLAELKPGYVHQVDLPTIKAADGTGLSSPEPVRSSRMSTS